MASATRTQKALTELSEAVAKSLPPSPVKAAVFRSIEDLSHLIQVAELEPRFKVEEQKRLSLED